MPINTQGILGGNQNAARNRPDGLNNAFDTLTRRLNDTFGNPQAAYPGYGDRINSDFVGSPWPHTLVFSRPNNNVSPPSPAFYPYTTWFGENQYGVLGQRNFFVPRLNPRTEGLIAAGGGQSSAMMNNAPLTAGLPVGRGTSGEDYDQPDSKVKPSPGFTPVQYYRTISPQWSEGDPAKPSPYRYTVMFPREPGVPSLYTPVQTTDRYNDFTRALRDGSTWTGTSDSPSSPTEDFRMTPFDENGLNYARIADPGDIVADDGSKRKTTLIDSYRPGEQITPYDNEDPIYYAFDLVIKYDSSPLFNGELGEFLDNYSDYDEITERKRIYQEFRKEFARYFRFNVEPVGIQDITNSIFNTRGGRDKKYYIQKIAGLDKLTEHNTPDAHKAFHKYRTDNLTLSFLEDTTLNMGTLYSLYKSLYWSRRWGKSIIPENLLRFDMEIQVFEVRDFVRVKRTVQQLNLNNSPDFFDQEDIEAVQEDPSQGILPYKLEILRANISKYVYQVYECQFFFDKATHPALVDMSEGPTMFKHVDVPISWKYSTQRLHRFDPFAGDYKSVGTGRDVVHSEESESGETRLVTLRRIDDVTVVREKPLSSVPQGGVEDLVVANGIRRITLTQPQPTIPNNPQPPNLFRQTTNNLLQSVKTAALEEGQRQLNSRFRLLNDTLDRIRNAYGIGRMRPPTNVYQIPPGGQFFFDVQNSLRNFGGDLLAGALGG